MRWNPALLGMVLITPGIDPQATVTMLMLVGFGQYVIGEILALRTDL